MATVKNQILEEIDLITQGSSYAVEIDSNNPLSIPLQKVIRILARICKSFLFPQVLNYQCLFNLPAN